MPNYLNFDLHIDKNTASGEYTVKVLDSPAGEMPAPIPFRIPFTGVDMENRLLKLKLALQSAGLIDKRKVAMTPEERAVRDFGEDLFKATFNDDVLALYRASQQRIRAQEVAGLRVRLRVTPPELASLPWEYLYDPNTGDFTRLSVNSPIVRYLELPQTPEPLRIAPPIRILGVVASPSDLHRLDVKGEMNRINEALRPLLESGWLHLEWLNSPTVAALQNAMRQGTWHVLHFIGHGDFDSQQGEGVLALVGTDGKKHLVPATVLGRILDENRQLRLVFLNACEGAKADERDLFSSTAATLVRRGIPAVLAMQYAITDAAAKELAQVFYQSLAEGQPVDAAISRARVAITARWNQSLEWGTPVLTMRSPDGVLFEMGEQSPPPRLPTALPALILMAGGLALLVVIGIIIGLAGRGNGTSPLVTANPTETDTVTATFTDTALPTETSLPSLTSTETLDPIAAAETLFFGGLTQTAALWTATPTETFTPSPNFTETVGARLTEIAIASYTKTPLPSDTPTYTLTPTLTHTSTSTPTFTATFTPTLTETSVPPTNTPTITLMLRPTLIPSGTSNTVWTPQTQDFNGVNMMLVPAGCFRMGSEDGGSDEKPVHEVCFDQPFWIDQTEVTQAQFKQFGGKSATRSYFTGNNRPVEQITWFEARDFCAQRGVRLPTEAEWEYAARGPEGLTYPWGNTFEANNVVYYSNSNNQTANVGSRPGGVSWVGALDMSGNVWEWVSSLYQPYPYKADDGRESTSDTNSDRVLRGGGWDYLVDLLRAALRFRLAPDDGNVLGGFRCARSYN